MQKKLKNIQFSFIFFNSWLSALVAWCEAFFYTKPQSHRALRGTTKQSECLETASISKWRITAALLTFVT
jgi:hypothetical protein